MLYFGMANRYPLNSLNVNNNESFLTLNYCMKLRKVLEKAQTIAPMAAEVFLP